MKYWSAHTHSRFSAKDALPSVESVVRTASDLGYEALGMTDHGNMAASAQLYKACRAAHIKPLPGIEAYIAIDRGGSRPSSMHMGMLATSERGYRNLVGLASLAHENFKYKPLLDLGDLAKAHEDGMLEGVVALSGCWFGVMPTLLRTTGEKVVHNVLDAMARWFDQLYVEIQNHMISDAEHDDDIQAGLLYEQAQALGLPIVITQDSHYCHAKDRPAHDTMKRLMSWSTDPDDAIFPGDGYHMVDDEWMADHHLEHIYTAGMEGLDDLCRRANVVIPELDAFHLKVPDMGLTMTPDEELKAKTKVKLEEMIEKGATGKDTAAYWERWEEELDVVHDAGFAGYLLFTATVTDFMRKESIFYGPRGSASGSLLCWLLGITFHDPIAWGLQFDRFISRDRTKPPDIDLDVEHLRREEVVAWLDETYTVVHIGTWLKLGAKDEDAQDEDQQKGSLIVRWRTNVNKMSKSCPACIARNKGTSGEWEPCSPEHDKNRRLTSAEWDELTAVASHEPYQGYGVHAAGLLIIPDWEAASGIPTQYVASSATTVTAFDMNDIEGFGLVKLDVLGLKTMTAIKDMTDMVGTDIWGIPFNDRKVYSRIGQGKTDGMFQLEGWSFTKGCQRMKPKNIHELIAAQALFRPAVQKSGATDEYLERRAGARKVPQRHPTIMEHTADTYGAILYQEQVINILKELGLTIEQIEKARKAIKASTEEGVAKAKVVMADITRSMITLGTEAGMSQDDLDYLQVALNAYASYGFNKAHATAYGTLAYITAWFSVHHPVEYWVSLLNAYVGSKPQEADYLKAARADGIKFRPPHVNKSGADYSVDATPLTIRKGLLSISGIGVKTAQELIEHAPYASLEDLGARVNARKVTGAKSLRSGHSPESCGGAITILNEVGALAGLEPTAEGAA